jgi:hypothetical protein
MFGYIRGLLCPKTEYRVSYYHLMAVATVQGMSANHLILRVMTTGTLFGHKIKHI